MGRNLGSEQNRTGLLPTRLLAFCFRREDRSQVSLNIHPVQIAKHSKLLAEGCSEFPKTNKELFLLVAHIPHHAATMFLFLNAVQREEITTRRTHNAKCFFGGGVVTGALQTIREFVSNLEKRLDDMRWFFPNGLGIKRPPIFKHRDNITHDDTLRFRCLPACAKP